MCCISISVLLVTNIGYRKRRLRQQTKQLLSLQEKENSKSAKHSSLHSLLRDFNLWSTMLPQAIAKLAENEVFSCGYDHAISRANNFRCQNGTCISMAHVCDGIRHCPDASDENFCKYSRKRSTRSNACTLPVYPRYGIYEVLTNPNARPGQSFDSFLLIVRCRRGYGVINKDGSTGNSSRVFCINGVWDQNMPECVRFCRLDPDPSVRYMCHMPGVGLKICGKYVAPGTLVNPICNTPIYYSTKSFPNMKCTTGFWNYVAQCEAECGRVSPEAFQLVIDGKEAKRGELPWHVGIYRKKSNTPEQICGGSLVSNNVVISAAHCFWSDVRKLLPASDYSVAIGKLYRSWNSERDGGVQKSDVKEIKIPTLFEGESANFQEDIAVLILTSPFVYKPYIRPVCLNFNVNFERLQLQPGNTGKVAGWGLTAANGDASPILKVVDLPFVSEIVCIKTLPISFREYITGDKFCAGYTNGTALCRGDSGGGLAFPDKELGVDRYYLRGIVSAAPRNDEKKCNDNAFTTFTKITKHQELINEALAESASRTCPFYSFQCDDGSCVDLGADCDGKPDCGDGSDESDELCRPGVDTPNLSQMSETACEWEGLKGQCVPSSVCLSALDDTLKRPKPPPCKNTSDNMPLVCCTDCDLVNDSSLLLFNPDLGILRKTGSKAKDKCLEYIHTLDYPCKKDSSLRNITVQRDPVGNCLRKVNNHHSVFYNTGKRDALRDEYPHMALLGYEDAGEERWLCGGTVISEKFILTAAHCLVGSGLVGPVKYVALGILKRSDPVQLWQRYNVKRTIKHPQYRRPLRYHDIGLLETDREIAFNKAVLPACLHVDDETDTNAYFTGWGVSTMNSELSDVLHSVFQMQSNEEECAKQNPPSRLLVNGYDNATQMCYGVKIADIVGTCQGDSGGPLQSQDHEQCVFTIIGVLSFGRSCGIKDYLDVYTRVKHYVPWIEEIVWPS